MTKQFTTAVKRVKKQPIEFEVDGRTFKFTPSQNDGAMLAGVVAARDAADALRVRLDWLESGLPEEDAAYFHERLRDVNDPFSVNDLLEVVVYLVGEISGHPTSSSGD